MKVNVDEKKRRPASTVPDGGRHFLVGQRCLSSSDFVPNVLFLAAKCDFEKRLKLCSLLVFCAWLTWNKYHHKSDES